MKISDRDKKLILFVLLAAIIALPIVFFIKPKREEIVASTAKIAELEVRFNELKALQDKMEEYQNRIVELNTERDAIIDGYSKGILQENTIMFLRGVELSEKPISMTHLAFAEEVEETPITEDSVNENGDFVEGLTAKKYVTTVNFSGEYVNIKAFLNYIFNNPDKMLISSINMAVNPETNLIDGSFVLEQYAVSGEGRSLEQTKVEGLLQGTDYPFKIYYDEKGMPKSANKNNEEENTEGAEATE